MTNNQPPAPEVTRAQTKGAAAMKTFYQSYGTTASVTDLHDKTARLIIRDINGKKLHDKIHANRKAALAAWHRYCN